MLASPSPEHDDLTSPDRLSVPPFGLSEPYSEIHLPSVRICVCKPHPFTHRETVAGKLTSACSRAGSLSGQSARRFQCAE